MASRRKRPHVPAEDRKRVARACNACRKVKEKCEGSAPCLRCSRLRRHCVFVDNAGSSEACNSQNNSHLDRHDFYNRDRLEALEAIVRHYTGCESLDTATVADIAANLQTLRQSVADASQQCDKVCDGPTYTTDDTKVVKEDYTIDPLNSTTAAYTCGLSNCDFSYHVHHKLNRDLHQSRKERAMPSRSKDDNLTRASRLHNRQLLIDSAANFLPPLEVSDFLMEMFFRFAQTNYSYVDEASLRQKLNRVYLDPKILTPADAAWLCTLLMVLAIGTQFAHLSSHEEQDGPAATSNADLEGSSSLDDDAALALYHAAAALIPYAVALASIESVQAFLLLAVYTLPIDAAGLSFTYLGIAVKMAIQNGMHRSYSKGMDVRTIEMRNRVWWSTYTLEKRVCVLHGRPTSLSSTEIDTELPKDLSSLQLENRINTLPNLLAMIKLTAVLENARDIISQIRRPIERESRSNIVSVMQLKHDLQKYWQTLPTEVHCRDLTPGGALLRFNVHLTLTYHLVHVFIGRIFMFTASSVESTTPEDANRTAGEMKFQDSLVVSCVQSAVAIIDLCQKLKRECGLARASYTEYTSCRAALLVILAQRIHRSNEDLRRACDQGMELLRHMSLGFYSADAEKSEIKAMQVAIQRLEEGNGTDNSDHSGRGDGTMAAYEQFRNWAMLWRSSSEEDSGSTSLHWDSSKGLSQSDSGSTAFGIFSPAQSLDWDIFMPSAGLGLEDDTLFNMPNMS